MNTLPTEVSYYLMLEYVLCFVANLPLSLRLGRNYNDKVSVSQDINRYTNIFPAEWDTVFRTGYASKASKDLHIDGLFSPLYWLMLASRKYSLPSATNEGYLRPCTRVQPGT